MKDNKRMNCTAILAVVLVSFLRQSTHGTNSLLADMAKSFPEVSASGIQLLSSIVGLVTIPALFLAAPLVKKMSLKRGALIAVGAVTITGALPYFIHSYPLMLAARLLFAASIGIMNPISASLITEWYEGEDQKRLMGYRTAISCLGSVVVSLIVGQLAVYNWNTAFLAYLVGVPVFVFIALFLPNDSRKAEEKIAKDKFVLNKAIIIEMVTLFFWMYFFSVTSINISQFVAQNREAFGLASEAVAKNASYLSSVYMLSSFLTGLVFTKITHVCKEYSQAVGILLCCAGDLLIATTNNLPQMFIGVIMGGIGLGIVPALSFVKAGAAASRGNKTMGIAVATAGMSLGAFLSPNTITRITTAYFDNQRRASYIIGTIGLACVFIVKLIEALKESKKAKA